MDIFLIFYKNRFLPDFRGPLHDAADFFRSVPTFFVQFSQK